MCHKDKKDLKGTAAYEYIRWGESQGFHRRPSCAGRPKWWDLGEREKPRIAVNYLVDEVMRFFGNPSGVYFSDNFQEVRVGSATFWELAVASNSSILQLAANVTGRANFGGGLMKIQTYEVADLPVLNPKLLDKAVCKQALLNVKMVGLTSPDRRILDELVFDALHISKADREAVYGAVSDLVAKRLNKANSLNGRKLEGVGVD